jgi:hypothetical protein
MIIRNDMSKEQQAETCRLHQSFSIHNRLFTAKQLLELGLIHKIYHWKDHTKYYRLPMDDPHQTIDLFD